MEDGNTNRDEHCTSGNVEPVASKSAATDGSLYEDVDIHIGPRSEVSI